ncbi:MAG: PAS domain-containing protein [Phycisphaerales bacterium]
MITAFIAGISALIPQEADDQHRLIFIGAFVAGALSVVCLWLFRRMQLRFCGENRISGRLSGVCFDHLNEAVIVFRLSDHRVVAANTAACQLYGKSRAEIAGRPIEVVENRLGGELDNILRKISLGLPPNFTAQFRSISGERSIDFSASLIDFDDEKCVLWVGRDITDRLAREDDIRRESEAYRSLFNRSDLALVVVEDATGKVLVANDRACSVLSGAKGPAPVGLPFRALVRQELPPAPARGVLEIPDDSRIPRKIRYEASKADFGGKPSTLYRLAQLTALSDRSDPLSAPDAPDVFRFAAEAMLIVDPASRTILHANPAAARMYGYTEAQMEGSSVEVISTDPQGCREICSMPSGDKRDCILRYQRRSDGSMIAVVCNFSHFQWDGKECLLCSMRPATVDVSKAIPVFVPQTINQSAALDSAAIVEAKPARGKVHVLVVDDEPMVRDVTVRMIELLGFRASSASGGEEAVELIRKYDDIEHVVLDVTMPDKTGPEIMDEMLAYRAELRVVLCSGYSADSVSFKVGPGGAAAFVQKPFTLDTLRGALGMTPDASRS